MIVLEKLKTHSLEPISPDMDDSKIVNYLEKLGKLPKDFNGDFLVNFLKSNNDKIRYLAVKNIGKLSSLSYINHLFKIALNDTNSNVRREATSSIGRIRKEEVITYLVKLLNDIDPKIILQAIRGLLVFKNNNYVKNELEKLSEHPNETIKYIISKEFEIIENDNSIISKHPETPDFMKNVIVKGDVLETLKFVPEKTIHLTFTSPPYYNARDYSIYKSYDEYLEFLNSVFKEVYRITKEGRFFLLNTSPVIVPRVSRQHASKRYPIPYDIHHYLIKMGWEYIDDIVWLKPEASVKNRNGGFYQHRKPLAYKPNTITECIMVYRKKTNKLLDWNMKQYSKDIVDKSKILDDYETSNVWKIDPTFDKTHSAVFPLELCNRVIKFYSFVGDLVFDPFAGSGTFGEAAKNLDRYFFLTEQEPKYIERIKERVFNKILMCKHIPKVLDLEEFAEKKGKSK